MAETGPSDAVRVEQLGEAALLVVLGERVDPALNRQARDLASALERRGALLPGLGVPVPAYASVALPFDPDVLTEPEVRAAITEALRGVDRARPEGDSADRDDREVVTIPVRYGGRDGPDLPAVAAATRCAEQDVVRLHVGPEYRVFCLGFVPGFPYLGLLPEELALPRRATPRLRVPAGSVAIAGRQTGIYPAVTPGGWHVIGRTDASIWDPRRSPPALLRPGARVRFVPA